MVWFLDFIESGTQSPSSVNTGTTKPVPSGNSTTPGRFGLFGTLCLSSINGQGNGTTTAGMSRSRSSRCDGYL